MTSEQQALMLGEFRKLFPEATISVFTRGLADGQVRVGAEFSFSTTCTFSTLMGVAEVLGTTDFHVSFGSEYHDCRISTVTDDSYTSTTFTFSVEWEKLAERWK